MALDLEIYEPGSRLDIFKLHKVLADQSDEYYAKYGKMAEEYKRYPGIYLSLVDHDGNLLPQGDVLWLDGTGLWHKLKLDPAYGLDLNERGYIKTENES
jgi:hypothetical protein